VEVWSLEWATPSGEPRPTLQSTGHRLGLTSRSLCSWCDLQYVTLWLSVCPMFSHLYNGAVLHLSLWVVAALIHIFGCLRMMTGKKQWLLLSPSLYSHYSKCLQVP
jgi:hypothetical protein